MDEPQQLDPALTRRLRESWQDWKAVRDPTLTEAEWERRWRNHVEIAERTRSRPVKNKDREAWKV